MNISLSFFFFWLGNFLLTKISQKPASDMLLYNLLKEFLEALELLCMNNPRQITKSTSKQSAKRKALEDEQNKLINLQASVTLQLRQKKNEVQCECSRSGSNSMKINSTHLNVTVRSWLMKFLKCYPEATSSWTLAFGQDWGHLVVVMNRVLTKYILFSVCKCQQQLQTTCLCFWARSELHFKIAMDFQVVHFCVFSNTLYLFCFVPTLKKHSGLDLKR